MHVPVRMSARTPKKYTLQQSAGRRAMITSSMSRLVAEGR